MKIGSLGVGWSCGTAGVHNLGGEHEVGGAVGDEERFEAQHSGAQHSRVHGGVIHTRPVPRSCCLHHLVLQFEGGLDESGGVGERVLQELRRHP